MSPQQDVSVRDLLAAGPAVSAVCTPPVSDVDEPGRVTPPDDEDEQVDRAERRQEREQGGAAR